MTRTPLFLDLTQVPFSREGSYLALSLRDGGEAPAWEQQPGDALFLRTVRGDRETDRVFRLHVLSLNSPLPDPVSFRVMAEPHLLRMSIPNGHVEIILPSNGVMRFRGQGQIGLRMTLVHVGGYGNAQPYDREGRWLVNAWTARMSYLLSPLSGRLAVDAPVEAMRVTHIAADFLPDSGTEGFEGALEEFLPEYKPAPPAESFDAQAAQVAAEFEKFRGAQPQVPANLQGTADLMAYVQWSALVAPDGHLRRRAMLMSKNHMTNIWSWDHCFNALALMPHDPLLAWDQLLLPFDHQDMAGALPDCVNDKTIVRSFTKPPIHGWALRGLLRSDRTGFLSNDRLAEIYEPLARWTRWWLTQRDQDADGVPQYNHGNDCGWDNSTAFDVGFPIESPDLGAFLVIQMDVLDDLARRLGRMAEADAWGREANGLLERTLAHGRRGDRFVAPQSETHRTAAGDSLILFLPLILGSRLPRELADALIDGLRVEGRFLTEWGPATESICSPLYEPDGYWRGPIWAPPTLLLVDALADFGETRLAADIADRFCRLVARSGSAENFDALSGEGCRDRAYTWTASVFLLLARGYLGRS